MVQVGDSIMLYLLVHADLFHPLPQRCFAQVAGTSVLLANEHFIQSFNSNVQGSLRRKKWIDSQQNKIGEVEHCFWYSRFFIIQDYLQR
jgi:hypothetical protein